MTTGKRLSTGLARVSGWAAALAMLAATVVAGAESVTFKDGNSTPFVGGTYAGTQDNGMFAGETNNNYGAGTFFDVGDAGAFGNVRRSLIRFDVTALAGQYSQINSITLNVYPQDHTDVLGPGTNTNTMQVFEINTLNGAWLEGTTAGAPQNGSPSWGNLAYDPTTPTPWVGGGGLGTPGTGYDATPLGSTVWNGSTPNNDAGNPFSISLLTGNTAALTSLINDWSSGSNPGMLLRGLNEPGNAYVVMRVNSADNGTAALRPELIIDYTPIPEPASIGLLALGAVALCVRRR